MSLFLRVLLVSEIEEILNFENLKLAEIIPDEMDRQIHSWNVRWRRESLEHYLPQGWSFAAREGPSEDDSALVGYFIAQPLIFFDGQTQSLWVEHLQFNGLHVRDSLCEVAIKWARDKHLQKVFFPNESRIANALASYKAELWQNQALQVRTTKV